MKIFKRRISLGLFLFTFFIYYGCNTNPTSQKVISCDPLDLPEGEWHLLGLETEEVTAIAVDPKDECIIYGGSGSDFSAGKVGGLFKSTDAGATWDTLITGITVWDIDIHPFDSDILYVTAGINYLTPSGILRSIDGGRKWSWVGGIPVVPDRGPTVLTIDPLNPNILYVGTAGFGSGALYKTTNAGLS